MQIPARSPWTGKRVPLYSTSRIGGIPGVERRLLRRALPSSTRFLMSRVVRSPWLVTLVLAFLLGGPLWYASCMRTTASVAAGPPMSPAQSPPTITPTELTDALLRSGFDAKALTAVGLPANGVDAFVSSYRD